jgi:hypothetical protein
LPVWCASASHHDWGVSDSTSLMPRSSSATLPLPRPSDEDDAAVRAGLVVLENGDWGVRGLRVGGWGRGTVMAVVESAGRDAD